MARYYQERENGYPPVGTPGLPVTINPDQDQHFVVAAIDFGTTYSGYAFAFKRDPDSVHMMRRWEGGDPGVTNMKVCVPTQYIILFIERSVPDAHDAVTEAKRRVSFFRFWCEGFLSRSRRQRSKEMAVL